MPKKNLEKLNKYQRKLILDMLIGDGSLTSDGRLRFKHSIQQEEYVLWKEKLLNEAGIETHIQYSDHFTFGKTHKDIRVGTKACIATKHMRHFLYRPNKFLFYPSFFKHLDDLSIAIWYMDDGSYCKTHKKNDYGYIRLYTCVPEEQNKLIQQFFKEKYDIDFLIKHRGANDLAKVPNRNCLLTHIETHLKKDTEKFISIVKPYVEQISIFKYKIDKDTFMSDCI